MEADLIGLVDHLRVETDGREVLKMPLSWLQIVDGRAIYQETNKRVVAGGLGSNEFQVLMKSSEKTNIRTELLCWKEGVGPLFSPSPPCLWKAGSTLVNIMDLLTFLYSSSSNKKVLIHRYWYHFKSIYKKDPPGLFLPSFPAMQCLSKEGALLYR